MSDVGKRIRRARAHVGLTQAELAEQVGLDRVAMTKIETGERQVKAEELAQIAKVVRSTADDLLREPAHIRYRINPASDPNKAAIEWFERCVDASLFVRSVLATNGG